MQSSHGHTSYASLLTNRLSQATVGCLMLAYSFSPRVHSIPRGPRIFARKDIKYFVRHKNEKFFSGKKDFVREKY